MTSGTIMTLSLCGVSFSAFFATCLAPLRDAWVCSGPPVIGWLVSWCRPVAHHHLLGSSPARLALGCLPSPPLPSRKFSCVCYPRDHVCGRAIYLARHTTRPYGSPRVRAQVSKLCSFCQMSHVGSLVFLGNVGAASQNLVFKHIYAKPLNWC